jgi:hypothetical protein
MLHREESVAYKRVNAYLLHRSNAALGRAVCFLGRFLPKLGGAACAAIFLSDHSVQKRFPGGHAPAILRRQCKTAVERARS